MREQTSAAGHNPTTVSLSTPIMSCRGGIRERQGGGEGGREGMEDTGWRGKGRDEKRGRKRGKRDTNKQ